MRPGTRINQSAIQHGSALFLVGVAGLIAVKEPVSLFTTRAEPPAPAREVEP